MEEQQVDTVVDAIHDLVVYCRINGAREALTAYASWLMDRGHEEHAEIVRGFRDQEYPMDTELVIRADNA